jgi:hypothetical protein
MCYLKKQSIFYKYLPHLKEFEIDHVIDTTHDAKGTIERTIVTLLDIPGKTKIRHKATTAPSRKTEWKVFKSRLGGGGG